MPFDSDALGAAAYKSAIALLLAMIFLFACICCQHVLSTTPAPEDVRAPLSSAQSESAYVATSVLI